jgi:hypothetical protein
MLATPLSRDWSNSGVYGVEVVYDFPALRAS